MSKLHSTHPLALQALLDETLFVVEDSETLEVEEEETIKLKGPESLPIQKEVEQDEEFVFEGKKDKGILVMIHNREYSYFSPEAEEAFGKMLNAVQLNNEEIVLLNLANDKNSTDFKEIMRFFAPKKIVMFGLDPALLKLPKMKDNTIVQGKTAVVFNTFNFEEVLTDSNIKKEFWRKFKEFIQL